MKISITNLIRRLWISISILLLMQNGFLFGQQWNPIGYSDFDQASYNSSSYPDIAIDGNNNPYIVYSDGSNNLGIIVRKFDGNKWVTIGNEGFSNGQASFNSIAIDNSGTPYVAFKGSSRINIMKFDGADWVSVGNAAFQANHEQFSIAINGNGVPYVVFENYSNKATVRKFDGNTWITVGNENISAGSIDYVSMAIDPNGNPYIVYKDGASNGKATVMKYNGSGWVTIGNAGFSAGTVNYTNIAIDDSGTPYVIYQDVANSNKATMMKYNGSSWVICGSAGFSPGIATYTSIELDNSGTPFVCFQDGNQSNKSTVMKFNSGTWVLVGNAGFSMESAYQNAIAINSDGIPYVVHYNGGSISTASVMKFNSSNWVTVGPVGFSSGWADFLDISISNNNLPYVVFSDKSFNNKATVMKFTGTNWVNVGNPGFTAGTAYYTSIALDNNDVPYVVFQDGANANKASVMKFNGSSWVLVGNSGISSNTASSTSISINQNGIPYIVYRDVISFNNPTTVKKFNGTNWETVGNAGFSGGSVWNTSIAFDPNGLPYVVFQNSLNSYKASVMKFNGYSWSTVGAAGFSSGSAGDIDIAIDRNGTPFVGYSDGGNSYKATVMKFNGSTWVNVGNAGFSGERVYHTSIAIDNEGTPYLAFQDGLYANQSKATVKKFNGSNWINVGEEKFTAGVAKNTKIAIDNEGTPVVTFLNGGAWAYKFGESLNADFSADTLTGTAPHTVHFTDLSTGSPTTWQWDFNNDGTIDSEEQHPVWVFNDPGTYTVSLSVSDGTNTNTETKQDYIAVDAPESGIINILPGQRTDGSKILDIEFDLYGNEPEYYVWLDVSFDNGVNFQTVNAVSGDTGWIAPAQNRQITWYAGDEFLDGFYSKTMRVKVSADFSIAEPPTVTTSAISNITSTTATSGGNVTSDGGASVTARGVVWSTSANPTVEQNQGMTNNGEGTGEFVSNLTGLSPATTYFVKAYATNSEGTSYGDELSFTTNQIVLEPVMELNPLVIEEIHHTIGQISTKTITVSNTGNAMLNFNVSTQISGNKTNKLKTNTPSNENKNNSKNLNGSIYSEISPNYIPGNAPVISDSDFDLQFEFPCGDASGEAGVESDGNYIYSTKWNGPQFFKYSLNGTFLGSFLITGASGVRDLAYDGTYFYGASGNTTLFQMDFTNLVLANTITAPTATRAIAYDEGEDGFWANNWSTPIVLYNRSGVALNTINTAGDESYYGLAYDPQGPYLWGYSQKTGTSANMLYKMSLPGGNIINQFDMLTVLSYPTYGQDIAGGLFFQPDLIEGYNTLGGLVQNTCIWGIEMGESVGNDWLTVEPVSGMVNPGDSAVITVTFNSTGLDYGVFNAELIVSGNDPQSPHTVPVTLSVIFVAELPTVITQAVTNITQTTATSGGNVTSDGGASVTARGVVWSTSANPTIEQNQGMTNNGEGTGEFVSSLTGFSASTTYFLRAYATNSAGTAYGDELIFTTLSAAFVCGNDFTDTRDGKVYGTVQIGTQCWMKQNLNIGTRIAGASNQTNNGTLEKYCYWNSESNCDVYGGLYQWDEMMGYTTTPGVQGICPTGWHLPTTTEWTTLANILGGENIAGGKLKEAGIAHWNSPNTGATNSSGFNALPGGGLWGGDFMNMNYNGLWWTSSQYGPWSSKYRSLWYSSASLSGYGNYDSTMKYEGHSIRCIRIDGLQTIPSMVTTSPISNITQTTATSGGNVTSDGGASVTARGVVWSTSANPTIEQNQGMTNNGEGTGEFVSSLTGLSASTTYFLRAYATNSAGTAYGDELSFTTISSFTCGSSFIDQRDGKTYTTVQIGTQCWMKQNLNIGTRINGTSNQTNNGTIEKYCYNNSESNCDVYGGLYQWDEMMGYTTSPGVQGICPMGWHLPTDGEWCTLLTYLDATVNCSVAGMTGTDVGGKMKEIGYAHWNSPNTGATNSSGFSALPSGQRATDGSFAWLNHYGYWRTSSEFNSLYSWRIYTGYNISTVSYSYTPKNDFGLPVRCIKNN